MNPYFSKITCFIIAFFFYLNFIETVKLSENYNIYSRIGTIAELFLLILISYYKPEFLDVNIF